MMTAHAEAVTLSQYLIGDRPSEQQIRLYGTATASRSSNITRQLRKPGLLPFFDAHDAFFRPNSELRGRLYLMFSILEASTAHTDKFLFRQRSPLFFIILPPYGLRAVFRLVVGVGLVKLGRY